MASTEEKMEVDEKQPAKDEPVEEGLEEKEKKEEEAKEEAEKKEETPKEEKEAQKMEAEEKEAAVPEEASGVAETPTTPTTAAAAAEQAGDDERSKRVYVGNLAWEVSWQDLKDHVKETGLDPTSAHIMTTPDGRSKGCGIVEFATTDDAQKAVLTLNDTELKGRRVFVREDREERPSGGAFGGHAFSSGKQAQGRRVYVGNLSWDVAWQDLKDHMRQAGEVLHAEIIMEHSGRSKGCGIVEYETSEMAQTAIELLTDTELKGRMIFVREDREIASQGGGGGGGVGGRTHNTSVYVWNLAPETSWQDLKDHMRRAGNVDSATILSNAQGESIGCGIVVYQRPQEAARAIRELYNSELNGQALFVREDRMQSGGRGRGGRGFGRGRGGHGRGYERIEEGTQLFVGNLSFETTWRELKDHFRQCGEVKRAEVKTTPTGHSKGFGIVAFYNKTDADAAISRLNGSELQGRELEVRLDQKAR